jgi:hypothetical protein
MARILATFPSALLAARQGMSANAFYRELQSLGLGARRGEVLALFREAKAIVAKAGNDVFEDPTLKPDTTSLLPWPTRSATGVKQNVLLTYRDRTTGEITKTFYSVTSESGITRQAAVDEAISAYSDNTERYNQDLIGAVHTSAYALTPVGV